MCGSCSLAESPGDLFRRPFSTLELLEQLGSGGASNVKLFLREPARLLRKTGDVELGIGRQLVCGDAPFFGNGVEQLLALFGGNFLPGWHGVNKISGSMILQKEDSHWLFCVVGSGRRRPAGVPPLARYRLPSANSREPTSGRGLQDVIAVTQKSEEEPPDGRVEKTRAFPLIASSEK